MKTKLLFKSLGLVLMACLLFAGASFAQNYTVSGTVYDANSNPLSGHEVWIIGDSNNNNNYFNSVFTDINGNYIDVIPNGGQPGPNLCWLVQVTDTCINPNVWLDTLICNNQGLDTSGVVDFTLSCNGGGNCAASFTSAPDSLNPNLYTFTSTSTGNNLTYVWTANGVQISTAQSFSHTFNSLPPWNVCLSISDGMGCTDITCTTLGGGGGGCTTGLSIASQTGLTVNFTSTPTGAAPFTFSWLFGDGNSSTLQNPSHTYSTAGSYMASVTVTDSSNCVSSDSILVTVSGGNTLFSISGSLFTGIPTADYATVYLIDYDQQQGTLTAIDTLDITPTDSGYYLFSGVSAGSYLVKAALTPSSSVYTSYLPSYYGNQLLWSNATFITVGPNSVGNNISLVAGVNLGGPGFVGGFTNQGANKKAGPGDPVEGAQVMLLQMNGDPVQYTYSDANGAFSFSNVAYGTYQVYVEELGLPTTPSIVTIGPDNPSEENVIILIGTTEVTTGIEDSPLEVSSINLFPNPTNGMINLEMDILNNTTVNVSVSNALGQEVVKESHILSLGHHLVSINLDHSPKGIYFLSVSAENGASASFKLIKQ